MLMDLMRQARAAISAGDFGRWSEPWLGEYRDAQRAALEIDPAHVGEKGVVTITDDQIRHSLEGAQIGQFGFRYRWSSTDPFPEFP